MSSSKGSRAAKNAWVTRRKQRQHEKSQQAGRKAHKETIRPSEYGYIDELVKTQGMRRKDVFHHDGIPDLMAITKDGKIRFFEIKPKKGSMKQKMLNPQQVNTIKDLLKHNYVDEVNLVRYEKREGKMIYEPPIELTRSNIKEYSQTVH